MWVCGREGRKYTGHVFQAMLNVVGVGCGVCVVVVVVVVRRCVCAHLFFNEHSPWWT